MSRVSNCLRTAGDRLVISTHHTWLHRLHRTVSTVMLEMQTCAPSWPHVGHRRGRYEFMWVMPIEWTDEALCGLYLPVADCSEAESDSMDTRLIAWLTPSRSCAAERNQRRQRNPSEARTSAESRNLKLLATDVRRRARRVGSRSR